MILLVLVNAETGRQSTAQAHSINTLSVFYIMELLNYVRGTYHLSTRFNLILGSFKEILDQKTKALYQRIDFIQISHIAAND